MISTFALETNEYWPVTLDMLVGNLPLGYALQLPPPESWMVGLIHYNGRGGQHLLRREDGHRCWFASERT